MPNLEGDGCSGAMSWGWKAATGRFPPWHGCCQAHDEAYRKGGPPEARLKADSELGECVVCEALKAGYAFVVASLVALAMYLGVRAGGWRNAPPLHLLAWPAVKLGWAKETLDYRWSRVK